jgi:hypothetical protein
MALLVGDQTTPVTWKIPNEPSAVRRLVKKLEREAPGDVRVFYEAGPCGYALQRQLTTPRVRCEVIAPALMPRKPGERVKTNVRDSCKLVELGRAGLLTAVHPPTPAEEAVRDLARARDDAREDLLCDRLWRSADGHCRSAPMRILQMRERNTNRVRRDDRPHEGLVADGIPVTRRHPLPRHGPGPTGATVSYPGNRRPPGRGVLVRESAIRS